MSGTTTGNSSGSQGQGNGNAGQNNSGNRSVSQGDRANRDTQQDTRAQVGDNTQDRLTEFQQLVEATSGRTVPIFGASLFRGVPSTFAPVDDVPVGPGYHCGYYHCR